MENRTAVVVAGAVTSTSTVPVREEVAGLTKVTPPSGLATAGSTATRPSNNPAAGKTANIRFFRTVNSFPCRVRNSRSRGHRCDLGRALRRRLVIGPDGVHDLVGTGPPFWREQAEAGEQHQRGQ